jgi:hypothetical protein
VNALIAEQAERRRLEQDFVSWKIEQARKRGLIRQRPASGVAGQWSWDALTKRAPAPPPSRTPSRRQAANVRTVTLPQPMTGWEIS